MKGIDDKVARTRRRKGLFSSITASKIPDAVYKQMVSLITNGHIKPGEKLPSEREMAFDLAVSRQSIREAISRAKSAGLIEVRQGEGTFVISSVRENFKSPLLLMLEEQAERIFEFLEIRKLIEGWCAEKASEAATPGDIKKMRGILKRMEKVEPMGTRWEKVDLDFHSSVAAATHNVIAMHLMEALKDSFESYFRVKKYTTRPERKALLLRQHKAIFDAIRRRDSQAAREKVLEHLAYVEEVITEDLGKNQ